MTTTSKPNASKSPPAPALACDLNAIPADARPRYHDLTRRLRAAVRARRPLPAGYVLELDAGFTAAEAAEWISLEKLCCPFLEFELLCPSGAGSSELKLTGPEGVKPILELEFPDR